MIAMLEWHDQLDIDCVFVCVCERETEERGQKN